MEIEGQILTPDNARSLRQRMGYVIQDGGLFPHLTARDNVTLLPRHLGWEKPRIEARVKELAELVRLPLTMIERYPAQLSEWAAPTGVGIMRARYS